jgi:hypothetical protein
MDMIEYLDVGKRYRITLRNPAFAGYLEGLLRSTHLPAGVLGNDDGKHRIWVEGELFDWFLETSDIDTIEPVRGEGDDPEYAPAPSRPLCRVGHPSAARRARTGLVKPAPARAHALPPPTSSVRRRRG